MVREWIVIFFLTVTFCLTENVPVSAEDIFLREYWMNISGNSVSDLTSDPNYPDNPIGSDYHQNAGYYSVDVNNCDPGILEFGYTYYWRVDRINNTEIWKGDVFKFTVLEYVPVDDFDAYTDTNDLLDVWSDGATNSTGSTIALDPVCSSMMFVYDNNEPPFYSQALLSYDTPQNWIASGVKALQLQFCGTKGNAAEQMYLVLGYGDVNSVVIHHDVNAATFNSWQFWNIDLQEFNDVNLAKINNFCIGFGDRDNPQTGGSGTVYFDDIMIHPSKCFAEHGPIADFDGDCLVDINDLGMMSRDWLMSDYNVIAAEPDHNGLQVCYRFDQTSGTIAVDSSGNNYHAIAEANDVNGIWNINGYDGNGCINLDGTFALSMPDGVFTNINEQVTISVWVYADANVNPDTIESVHFDAGPEDQNQWDRVNWNPERPDAYASRWNHYTLVKDANQGIMKIYHNGLLVSQNTNAFEPVNGAQAGTSTIGARNSYGYYKGKLDDFRIYDYALSHSQVLYLAAGTGSELHQPLQPVLSHFDPYHDGKINFKDLAVLASAWLQQKLWPDW